MPRLPVVLALSLATQAAAQDRHDPDVSFRGILLVNGFYTDSTADDRVRPRLAMPGDPASPFPLGSIGATARQSRLALRVQRGDVLGGTARALAEVDFAAGSTGTPTPRLRRVRAEVRWPYGWVMAGQDAPPIAELNPVSFAAFATPEFAASGNLWLWLPQVRLGAGTAGPTGVGIEGAVIAPRAPFGAVADPAQGDRAERSGRPYLQGRGLFRLDAGVLEAHLSLGGHLGWLAGGLDTLVTTQGIAGTLRVEVTDYVELRGELFSGEGLAAYDGETVDRILGPGELPVRATGGWGQVNVRVGDVIVGGGFGIDDVTDGDLSPTLAAAAGRLENRTIETHLHWEPRPLLLGVTWRRLETTYAAPVGERVLHHLNVAAGFVF